MFDQFPKGHPVIDVACVKELEDDVLLLLARKKGESKYRFIGGFFDVKKDSCYEDTAIREFEEETGGGKLDITTLTYLSSNIIDDKRFKDSKDCMISTLFIAEFEPDFNGELKASDDIVEVKWFNITNIEDIEEGKKFAKKNMIVDHYYMAMSFFNFYTEYL